MFASSVFPCVVFVTPGGHDGISPPNSGHHDEIHSPWNVHVERLVAVSWQGAGQVGLDLGCLASRGSGNEEYVLHLDEPREQGSGNPALLTRLLFSRHALVFSRPDKA